MIVPPADNCLNQLLHMPGWLSIKHVKTTIGVIGLMQFISKIIHTGHVSNIGSHGNISSHAHGQMGG